MKALYYGDNFQVLRDSIATESVDLIYLDPPFSSDIGLGLCISEIHQQCRPCLIV
jgi:16S rRNA G966 N2-methylase RsmD